MVIHVGINPEKGKVSTYNTETKTFYSFSITVINLLEDTIDINKQMYKEIRSKINGEFGCGCIYACFYSQISRKHFVESGLQNGFNKIQLIGDDESRFFTALSQSKYNHEHSNIILICFGSFVFVWQKEDGIFQYKNGFSVDKQNFYFQEHDKVTYENCLFTEKEEFQLPDFQKILITITVDKNGISTLKFSDIYNFNLNTTTSYIFPDKIQISKDKINAIGIDLGTSRCCAAVNRKNGIDTVALDNTGQRLLPSYVAYDEMKEKCGQLVIDRLRNFASSTVFDAKRLIGKQYEDIRIDKSWTFELKQVPHAADGQVQQYHNCLMKISKANEVIFKRPEEVSAVLLKHIKQKAEEFQGKELSDVVITVPAAFNDNQKLATCEAGKLAGWKAIYLLPEPVAAAFAYFIDRSIPDNSNLLLFDLGGGTLDICIFRIQKNQLKIISNNGDPNLGGRDFDNLLINFFEEKLENDFGVEVHGGKKYKLMQECQKIKENLSNLNEDSFDVEIINPAIDENISITRNEFEKMSAELLSRIREHIETSLNKINIPNNKINKILHVGGGCRMPMISTLLQEIFPNSEHIREQKLDEVVAVGAAYYSYYLNLPPQKNQCSII